MDDRIDELITLAALGELTDAEQVELDAAAAADPAVAAELAAVLETVADLAAATPVAPSPSLRAGVLDAIAGTPQEPAATTSGAERADVVDLGARRRSRRRLVTAVSAAAAAVVVVGGAWFVVSDTDSDPVEQIAEAPDAVERTFEGELGGELVLFHSASEGAVALDGSGLDRPGDGNVYVLWTISDDGVTAVGEFSPDDDGRVDLRLDGVDPTGSTLGVTEEPEGEDHVAPTLPIKASA